MSDEAGSILRAEAAVEDWQVLGLYVWGALDGSGGIDVCDDLFGLLRCVAELDESLRDGVVDNFDDAATDQLLVFHKCEIGFDAGCVAVHHETDRSGGCEDGGLGIAEASLSTEFVG